MTEIYKDVRDKCKIVLFSKHFTRNIRGIYSVLNNSSQFRNQVCWVTFSENSYNELKDEIPAYFYSIEPGHQHTWNMFESADILITDDVIPSLEGFDWLTRKLIRIQLWHGVPFKDIGLRSLLRHDTFEGYMKIRKFLETSDFFLVPSEADLPMYSRLFPNAKHFVLPEPKIETIFSDDLFQPKYMKRFNQFQKSHKIKNIRSTILWAPTFRETGDVWNELLPEDVNEVAKRLGVLLIYKAHPHDGFLAKLNFDHLSNIFVVRDTEDVYDFVRVSDAVISDYSSLLLELDRLTVPVIRWVPDEISYLARHGYLETSESMNKIPKYSIFEDALIACMSKSQEVRVKPEIAGPWLHFISKLVPCR